MASKEKITQRILIAFLLGVFSTLAVPPLNLFPVFFLTFPALMLCLDRCRKPWESFATGWVFGLGFFLFSLYWTPYGLLGNLSKWWWAVLVLWVALPLALSFFSGALVGGIYALFPRTNSLRRVVLFSSLWALMEWVRGHIFTGFPWSLAGYAWTENDIVLQTTSVIGIYGLSLLTVFLASLPYLLFSKDARSWQHGWKVGALLFFAVVLFGILRLSNASVEYHPDIHLRLVQANPLGGGKWDEASKWKSLQGHVRLSLGPAQTPPTHLIWPEVALTYADFETRADVRQELKKVVPENGHLLTGWLPPARDVNDKDYYNTLIALDPDLKIVAMHKKFHLVPLGEYALFKNIFKKSIAITVLTSDTLPGPGPGTINLPGLPPFSPLICYEVIFPDRVVDPHTHPQWLLNITNDNWFGSTAGPHQHLAIARVRAVEEGLPLVRAAISGISAVTDPYGRVLQRLDLKVPAVLDTALPKPTDTPTVYSYYGDTIFFALLLVGFAICTTLRRG